jgi:hypothetical protein
MNGDTGDVKGATCSVGIASRSTKVNLDVTGLNVLQSAA